MSITDWKIEGFLRTRPLLFDWLDHTVSRACSVYYNSSMKMKEDTQNFTVIYIGLSGDNSSM